MILHVLGAGVVIGIVVLALLSVFTAPISARDIDRLHFVSRFGRWASARQLVTGIILSAQDWAEFRSSRLFWTKMARYVIEGTLASRLLERQANGVAAQTAAGKRSVAAISA